MDTFLYLRLGLMMFLQFGIWGAWSPVLAARLLGPLKMSGKQTGWIYGTLYLGAIVSPLIGGLITDRWVATQWFLAGAHLVGGVLLLVAATKRTFRGLFAVMCLYALAYMSTLPLVNGLMFRHLERAGVKPFAVFVWSVTAWVLVGWVLSAWRRAKGSGEGKDCLILAGVLSLVMAVYSLTLPHTPPLETHGAVLPFVQAFQLLGQPNFLIFLIVAFVVSTQLQFYFLGTARYLGDLGVQEKNVPALMTIAQATQIVVMALLASYQDELLGAIGFRWTFAIGAASWGMMYVIYALTRPRGLVIGSMALHGLAYTFFISLGYVYVNEVAPEAIRNSGQALYTVVQMGFGFFIGTQFAGVVMDRLQTDGKFRWRPIFAVPCVLIFAGAIALAVLFRG